MLLVTARELLLLWAFGHRAATARRAATVTPCVDISRDCIGHAAACVERSLWPRALEAVTEAASVPTVASAPPSRMGTTIWRARAPWDLATRYTHRLHFCPTRAALGALAHRRPRCTTRWATLAYELTGWYDCCCYATRFCASDKRFGRPCALATWLLHARVSASAIMSSAAPNDTNAAVLSRLHDGGLHLC